MSSHETEVDFEEEKRDAMGSRSIWADTGKIEEEIPAWLGSAPDITDSMVSREYDADVVVIGAGIAGISAARAAAEEGASVIVIEQSPRITVRGMVFGCVDSRVHKAAGCRIDKMELLNLIMRRMGNRPNARLWKMWLDESGEAFDWFEAPLIETGIEFKRHLQYWPNPDSYVRERELYPQYCAGIEFEDWYGACKAHYMKSVRHGAKYFFNTAAQLLIRENNRVTGVYALSEEGEFIKYKSKNGVILATGDYGANKEMARTLCPEFYNTLGLVASRTSAGMGHKMAIWAGGMMEEGPHAHISHSFPGSFVMGTTAALNLNAKGDRYMNEDVPGQTFTNQIIRQPFKFGWQIFDSDWERMLFNQNIAHGAIDINTYDRDRINAQLEDAKQGKARNIEAADTIEELIKKTGMPFDRAHASINRYNELCRIGRDEDFGKRSDRLYPIKNPPFFAAKSFVARGVICGGITVDEQCRVLEKDTWEPIGGLWAVGNTGGGRYYCDYPVSPVCATSHGTAVTFGRHVGRAAAR
ncbi:MAG: FAD-dependent oxidoreductase [Clostridiales bacterium]|nr:FAD-dependent oxidoreductase [Clostridiales bacterium]